MRSPHDLHGAFDLTPFVRFLGLALALARQRVLGSFGDGRRAMLLEHLPRDGVDLRLGSHVALPDVSVNRAAGTGPAVILRPVLKTAEPAVSFPSSPRSRHSGSPHAVAKAATTSPSHCHALATPGWTPALGRGPSHSLIPLVTRACGCDWIEPGARPMDSKQKPVEADDPHDAPAIAPDIIPAARADKRHASDQNPGMESSIAGGAPALTIDTTFRPAAVGNVQAPREKPPAGKWATSAILAFMFVLCGGIAAAAWQHYGDAAKQMVSNWTPRFALASSRPSEQTAPAGHPDASAVQASAADQAPPQPTTSAQPSERAASDTAAPSPESSPLIQSMARDLAAMGQQIEQLKASIADLKAGQQPMARDISKTSESRTSESKTSEARTFDARSFDAKTSESRTPEAKTSAVRTSVPGTRQRMSALSPPLRSAPAPARRPMPAYLPVRAAAAPPLPLAAPPAAPPQPAPPPQVAAAPADEPVMRPPRPLP
jgi:hypothetical protein